jgi:hypothetical protein
VTIVVGITQLGTSSTRTIEEEKKLNENLDVALDFSSSPFTQLGGTIGAVYAGDKEGMEAGIAIGGSVGEVVEMKRTLSSPINPTHKENLFNSFDLYESIIKLKKHSEELTEKKEQTKTMKFSKEEALELTEKKKQTKTMKFSKGKALEIGGKRVVLESPTKSRAKDVANQISIQAHKKAEQQSDTLIVY